MNLAGAISAYVDELLGSDGVENFQELIAATPDAGAVALARLRLQIVEELLVEGWRAPEEEWPALEEQWQIRKENGTPPSDTVDGANGEDRHAVLGAHIRQALVAASESQRDRPTLQPFRALRAELTQLRRAMQSRATIEQAKGILMGWYRISADGAWTYLLRASQNGNIKLRTVAEDITRQAQHGPPADRKSTDPD